jgi:hypothetical protein
MYRKSESPTKAMEATAATELPPPSPQDATRFWYDWAQDCAAVMSKLGGKTVYSHKYCDLNYGTRMCICIDGSTWTTAEYAQADGEEQEEEEPEEEEQEQEEPEDEEYQESIMIRAISRAMGRGRGRGKRRVR